MNLILVIIYEIYVLSIIKNLFFIDEDEELDIEDGDLVY